MLVVPLLAAGPGAAVVLGAPVLVPASPSRGALGFSASVFDSFAFTVEELTFGKLLGVAVLPLLIAVADFSPLIVLVGDGLAFGLVASPIVVGALFSPLMPFGDVFSLGLVVSLFSLFTPVTAGLVSTSLAFGPFELGSVVLTSCALGFLFDSAGSGVLPSTDTLKGETSDTVDSKAPFTALGFGDSTF